MHEIHFKIPATQTAVIITWKVRWRLCSLPLSVWEPGEPGGPTAMSFSQSIAEFDIAANVFF